MFAFLKLLSMPILRALGLGLVIVIFEIFVPRVFHSFENTLVAAFTTAQVVMSLPAEGLKGGPSFVLPPSFFQF